MSHYTSNQKSYTDWMRILFMALLVSGLLVSCGDEEIEPQMPSESTNKIMPLGASRVEGNRPNFESYRYELWKLLLEEDWDFDYIGTRTDDADYESFDDMEFDTDHEGRGGWTSAQILEGLEEWLEAVGPVDVVLFSSPGGNDILNGLESYEETIANINGIIDLLQATHPDITVIIEQTAPAKSDFTTPKLSEDFMRVNAEILRIAEEQNTAETPVIAVDMFTGFDDSHLADDVHYNESGAQLIAARYLEVLQDVLQR